MLSACPDTSAVRAGVDPCLHGNPKFPGSETKVSSSSALSVFPEMRRLGPDRSHTEKQKKLTNCAKITVFRLSGDFAVGSLAGFASGVAVRHSPDDETGRIDVRRDGNVTIYIYIYMSVATIFYLLMKYTTKLVTR